MRFVLACSTICVPLCLGAQGIQFDNPQPGAGHPQRVTLDSEAAVVDAGKPSWVEIRFRVAPGFHINSHAPHDELLIPTALRLTSSNGVRILNDIYPAGLPLRLNVGAGETISTYEGEFRVRVQVVAAKGDSRLSGSLHYQACNAASCFPPRDLPVDLPLSAR